MFLLGPRWPRLPLLEGLLIRSQAFPPRGWSETGTICCVELPSSNRGNNPASSTRFS